MENRFFSYKIKSRKKLYKAYCFFIKDEIYITILTIKNIITVIKLCNEKISKYSNYKNSFDFYNFLKQGENKEHPWYGIADNYYVYIDLDFKWTPLEVFVHDMKVEIDDMSIKDYYPSYQLKETYPNCPYEVGKVFDCNQVNENNEYFTIVNGYVLTQAFFEKYTHLFKYLGMQKETNHLIL